MSNIANIAMMVLGQSCTLERYTQPKTEANDRVASADVEKRQIVAKTRTSAFVALRSVHRGAYADAALTGACGGCLTATDRRLATELVYG